MSALEEVFVRVHFRYELDPYAEDLERFASWLLGVGYPNKTARTHLFRVQQVLHAIGVPSGAVIDPEELERAFKRIARRHWKYCHTHAAYMRYLRMTGRLVEAPAEPLDPVGTLAD